ncbi:MAG: polyprenyl synthetase family protein [Finegoldia sp.]|nr:polyprenyl synthetase family protein [Finegoldia sp.]
MEIKELVAKINKAIEDLSYPEDMVGEAMAYAMVDGQAKRIRPLLFLMVIEMLGEDPFKYINYALAIELIHNYSLVHDDLECMDNDKYRRGKLTVHYKYGEAIGVLVGDGLLNYAYEILTENINDQAGKNFSSYLGKMAGSYGLILGQSMDMDDKISIDNIEEMYDKKTCYLIKAASKGAGLVTGQDEDVLEKLEDFGYCLGMAFQLKDDILDYDQDKDAGKKTVATLLGKEETTERASLLTKRAIDILKEFEDSSDLIYLTSDLLDRKI